MAIELTPKKLEQTAAATLTGYKEIVRPEYWMAFQSGLALLKKDIEKRHSERGHKKRIPQEVVLAAFRTTWGRNQEYLNLAYEKKASQDGIEKIESESEGIDFFMTELVRLYKSPLMHQRYRKVSDEILAENGFPF